MKKELFEQIKKELMTMGIILILSVLAFKIIFLSESFFVVLRTVISIFWIVFLPGFFVMLYWREKLKFYERLIIGALVATAITGISSYYFGLMGIHIKYHAIILPLIMILVGILINLKEIKK